MVCHPRFHACPADLGVFTSECCCAPEFTSTVHIHCGRAVSSVCGVECHQKGASGNRGSQLGTENISTYTSDRLEISPELFNHKEQG